MTKNTYNPYEIMMDKYDKEEMLSDVREAMLYQLGVDVSCEELNHFSPARAKPHYLAVRSGSSALQSKRCWSSIICMRGMRRWLSRSRR